MELLQCRDRCLKKFSVGESFVPDGNAYIVQQIESNDMQREEELRKQGFSFHERLLFIEISLKEAGTRKGIENDAPGIALEMSREYPPDIYELAYESFETDRRFHLERQFDQNRAKAVKEAYINRCRERGCMVFSARKDGKLLGYIIVDTHPGRGDGCFQIMLGVTCAGIRGKLTAIPLYNGLLEYMAMPENGGFTKYCGYVSTTNTASINLHSYLGGKVVGTVDEYIWMVEDTEKMEGNNLIECLIDEILHRIPGQAFSIRKTMREWTNDEKKRFAQELAYLTEKYSQEEIVEGYLFYTESVMKESRYFKEHGDYRCHSFEEVDAYIYADAERMKHYMLGLAVAEFLWMTVLKIHRFYEALIQNVSGERYLEIGPGHGKYFFEAYQLQRFAQYDAVDVSETAIAMTKDYMERYIAQNIGGGVKNYHLICGDATKLSFDAGYDFVVIQEVLEHIEDPLGMLRSIYRILAPNGKVYALFPINAPSPAHIFLFHSIAHVKEMVAEAGFELLQEEYITANNVTVEQAEEKKMPIDACMVLVKS